MKKYLIIFLIPTTYLLYYSNFNAVGVVMDTRLIVVILAFVIVSFLIFFILKERKSYLYVLLVLSLPLPVLSVNEYFFTYKEEETCFQSSGINFCGSLYIPKSNNTNCLVVFLHGSGSENRNEYAFHARQLARNGITSFAYDKRGSGKSGGNTYDVGYYGYAQDALAAVTKISASNKFDKVGLFAVSEGEWVSLIVESLYPIDFIVMVSASGTSPLLQTLREMTYRLEQKGFDSNDIREAGILYNEILTFDNDSVNRIKIENSIRQFKTKSWFQEGEDFSEELYYYPWWSKVMYFNPVSYLENSNADIFVLVGKENESYPVDETVRNFEKYKNVKTVVFDKGDHSLLDWKLGKGVPPPFFVKGYLRTYTEWIAEHCNKN